MECMHESLPQFFPCPHVYSVQLFRMDCFAHNDFSLAEGCTLHFRQILQLRRIYLYKTCTFFFKSVVNTSNKLARLSEVVR